MLMASDSKLGFPVNLGNPNEIDILTIANKIIEITKSDSKIVFVPALADDVIRRKPDASLAEELLNWKAQISLEDGLKKTFKYLQS